MEPSLRRENEKNTPKQVVAVFILTFPVAIVANPWEEKSKRWTIALKSGVQMLRLINWYPFVQVLEMSFSTGLLLFVRMMLLVSPSWKVKPFFLVLDKRQLKPSPVQRQPASGSLSWADPTPKNNSWTQRSWNTWNWGPPNMAKSQHQNCLFSSQQCPKARVFPKAVQPLAPGISV